MHFFSLRHLPLLAGLGFVLALGISTEARGQAPQLSPAHQQVKKSSKAPKTQIHWLVKPANVEIHLNGKKLGAAQDLKFTRAKPGKHTIRLVNGLDETEFDVKILKNQTLRFEFIFES